MRWKAFAIGKVESCILIFELAKPARLAHRPLSNVRRATPASA